jgi:hypothetical protein
MHPEGPLVSGLEPTKGLPAVIPPSGKFIVQLFLVPFLIVAGIVSFLLTVNWLVGTARTPEGYLAKLDSANPDVRWRAAEDLAQVLLRNEQLACDPKFALDLADRLSLALRSSTGQQTSDSRDPRLQLRSEVAKERLLQQPDQDYTLYLSACLGNVMIPVGAPLLCEMAVTERGSDAALVARRRWRSVLILASLGESLRRFGKLSSERRQAVLRDLENAAVISDSGRGERAGKALEYLSGPRARSLEVLGVFKALVRCAEDPDPFLRAMTAFALTFWDGLPSENARLEDVLAKLARDDGHGEEILASFRDSLRDSEEAADEGVTRAPGLKIRYNATLALARRGSNKVRLGVLREMLDESQQRENFRLKRKNGEDVPDEATSNLIVVTALRAVSEMHSKVPDRNLSELYPAVDELAKSTNVALRSEAEKTLGALGRK